MMPLKCDENSNGHFCVSRIHFLNYGFPFSRLRAEALRRASTGMT